MCGDDATQRLKINAANDVVPHAEAPAAKKNKTAARPCHTQKNTFAAKLFGALFLAAKRKIRATRTLNRKLATQTPSEFVSSELLNF